MKVKILLKDVKTGKKFFKTFETEFERDKFLRKLRYSTRLVILDDFKDDWLD